jgi:nucleotide-binding universal stress UspA family protein
MTAKTRNPRLESVSPQRARQGFRSLLVAVDLTASSDRVLARLAQLPLADDARVTLLHVVPAGFNVAEQRSAEQDADKAIAEEVSHLRKQLGRKVRVEPLVKVGAAAREIAACATKVKAELILMGRGSGRALKEAFLGSNAERVVRQTKRPVLVVRSVARAVYRRPVLAFALDQASDDSVRLLLRVTGPSRLRVEVVHAFEIPYAGAVYRSLTEEQAAERKNELRSLVTRRVTKRLASAQAKAGVLPEDGPSWRTHVGCGSPWTIVQKAVKKAESDLLVLGTHGYSGAAYVLLGTVAGELLRAARCDVLMVPPAPKE